jgi:hypothetical protein
VRSSRLVTTDDWPASELRAAVLAGDLVVVGDCWASVAEPQDPALRAASFAWSVGDDRLVAAGRSAAWVWGACSRPPVHHDAAVPADHRVRCRGAGTRVRELAIGVDDVVELGGVRVLTPLAAVVDLLRSRDGFGVAEDRVVRDLMTTGPVAAEDVRRAVTALHQVPMARQAERRFNDLVGGPS